MSLSLDEHQRRELLGLSLLALALLLALSLVPPSVLGASGPRLFPTGNIVGVAGGYLASGAFLLLGAAAVLLPVFPALWGLVAFDRLRTVRAVRWTVLLAGAGLLVPPAIWVIGRPGDAAAAFAGWAGAISGDLLATAFGMVGALLILGFGFAALCVATVRWNPLRTAGGAGFSALSGTRRLVERGRGRLPSWGRRPAHAAEEAAFDDSPPWEDEDATVAESSKPARTRKTAKAPSSEAPAPFSVDAGDPSSASMPVSTLLDAPARGNDARSAQELDDLGQVLVDKLATFRISGDIVGRTTGPVVTQFEVAPAPGVKVSRIAALDSDLALAMRAPSIRIIAPIPGKAAVGVEVPNPTPEIVFFREVIESAQFRGSRAQLPLALGKDISGKPYVADLARMPHLLIAGATGSGKSVCINTVITSLVFRHSPRSLRLLMVDPKMVELSMYNDLPHLRHPVVTDNSEAAGVLRWAVLEMERRYALLSANGVRNLQDFNRRVEDGQTIRNVEADGEEGDEDRWIYKDGPLPFVVLIIDELADLMMTVQGEVEKPLALLAQKARAIGIHLILATQRPSVNVITGLIKANFPSRIAFRVSSKIDSRTILDQNGADTLLGNGDMLFLPPGRSDPVRVQGAYISTEETERLMKFYREQAELDEAAALRHEADILDIVRSTEADAGGSAAEEALEDRDQLFREAAQLCMSQQGGSTSLLQRRLRIGYGRAARIVDQLHHAGVLGPPDGSKPRDVLMDMVQFEQFYPGD